MNVDMLTPNIMATGDLSQWFTTAAGVTVGSGNGSRGGNTWQVNGAGGAAGFVRNCMKAPSGNSFAVGYRVRFNGLNGSHPILKIFGAGNQHLTVWVKSVDGTIEVSRGSTQGVNVLSNTSFALIANTWYFLELEGVLSISATGSVKTYVNSTERASASSVVTALVNPVFNSYGCQATNAAGGNIILVEDAYANDGSGGVNTVHWGDTRIDAHDPNDNGTNRDFSPSTGTDDYPVVDEATPNGDTDYLESGTFGDRVTMPSASLANSGAPIKAAALLWNGRKTDAGDGLLGGCLRIGGVNYDAGGQALTTAYLGYGQPYDVSPATASAFTESEFNAMEKGLKSGT